MPSFLKPNIAKHTMAEQELREEGQNKGVHKIHQNVGPAAPRLWLLRNVMFLGTDCASGLTQPRQVLEQKTQSWGGKT